jgi:hypothetical protein
MSRKENSSTGLLLWHAGAALRKSKLSPKHESRLQNAAAHGMHACIGSMHAHAGLSVSSIHHIGGYYHTSKNKKRFHRHDYGSQAMRCMRFLAPARTFKAIAFDLNNG